MTYDKEPKDVERLFEQSAYEPDDEQLQRLMAHAQRIPERSKSEKRKSYRWAGWAAAAVLVLGVGAVASWQLGGHGQPDQVASVVQPDDSAAQTPPAVTIAKAKSPAKSHSSNGAAVQIPDESQNDLQEDEDEQDLTAALGGYLGDDDVFSALDELHELGDEADYPGHGG